MRRLFGDFKLTLVNFSPTNTCLSNSRFNSQFADFFLPLCFLSFFLLSANLKLYLKQITAEMDS